MLKLLDGKKTYIIGAAMFLLAGTHAIKDMVPGLSSIPDEYWKQAMQFVQEGGLMGLAVLFLRMGVKKGEV